MHLAAKPLASASAEILVMSRLTIACLLIQRERGTEQSGSSRSSSSTAPSTAMMLTELEVRLLQSAHAPPLSR